MLNSIIGVIIGMGVGVILWMIFDMYRMYQDEKGDATVSVVTGRDPLGRRTTIEIATWEVQALAMHGVYFQNEKGQWYARDALRSAACRRIFL
jgi:hypothetical protein